jgi:DNA-binding transcriptional ArsR family regulator
MELHDRSLTDPRELRALAHPVRLRLLQALYDRGEATATELAEAAGESPANCSWHLRQLAKFGFVQEAGTGVGRRRPWKPIARSLSWGAGSESEALASAGDVLNSALQEEEFAALRAWQAWRRSDPPEWQEAANLAQGVAWLTAEELAEVNAEFAQIMRRHLDRAADPSIRPAGARRIRMFSWAVPAQPATDESGTN